MTDHRALLEEAGKIIKRVALDYFLPGSSSWLASVDIYNRITAALAEPAAPGALQDMETRKDAAYEERNKVVAALARLFPSGTARTNIPGWDQEWHGCVYIDLPTGQVSWHYHDSQSYLFKALPAYTKPWDGHDTPEKYRRLGALTAALAEALVQAVEGFPGYGTSRNADGVRLKDHPAWVAFYNATKSAPEE